MLLKINLSEVSLAQRALIEVSQRSDQRHKSRHHWSKLATAFL